MTRDKNAIDAICERAKDPATSPATLAVYAEHPYEEVRYEVARNPNASIKVIERLARDARWYVRCGVCANPALPPKMLVHFSKDPLPAVREALGENTSLTRELFQTLATDIEWRPRAAVGRNTKTPADILVMLAQDDFYLVRGQVAKNPNTPSAALDDLSQDPNEYVRNLWADNPVVRAKRASAAQGVLAEQPKIKAEQPQKGNKRVFVAITGMFTHPKYNDQYPVIIVNRKMFMPAKYMAWQGKIGLFGGALEPGETPLEAAMRELHEELPVLSTLSAIGTSDLVQAYSDDQIIVFSCRVAESIDQSFAQALGGSCTEGLVDFLDQHRLLRTPVGDFIYPSLKNVLSNLLFLSLGLPWEVSFTQASKTFF